MTGRRILAAGLFWVAAAGCDPAGAPPRTAPSKAGRDAEAEAPQPAGPGPVRVADGVWYSLEDGEERNRLDPDTFRIPPREARGDLRPGQIVKLLFAITVGGAEQVERMWVVVQAREGGDYIGVLDNQPASTDKMRPGMPVRFQPRHVIAIHPKQAGEK